MFTVSRAMIWQQLATMSNDQLADLYYMVSDERIRRQLPIDFPPLATKEEENIDVGDLHE